MPNSIAQEPINILFDPKAVVKKRRLGNRSNSNFKFISKNSRENR